RDPARVARAAGRPREVAGDSHPREMTICPATAGKQNSAYGPTALLPMSSPSKPYPAQWEEVADLRVFRTTSEEWEKLIGRRADIRKRGRKPLRVASDGRE